MNLYSILESRDKTLRGSGTSRTNVNRMTRPIGTDATRDLITARTYGAKFLVAHHIATRSLVLRSKERLYVVQLYRESRQILIARVIGNATADRATEAVMTDIITRRERCELKLTVNPIRERGRNSTSVRLFQESPNISCCLLNSAQAVGVTAKRSSAHTCGNSRPL